MQDGTGVRGIQGESTENTKATKWGGPAFVSFRDFRGPNLSSAKGGERVNAGAVRFLPTPFIILSSLFILAAPLAVSAQTVVVAPYVQPGNGVSLEGSDVKVIAWLTDPTPGEFIVEYGVKGAPLQTATPTRVALDFAIANPAAKPAPTVDPAKPAGAPTTIDEFKKETEKSTSPPIPEKPQHFLKYAAELTGLPFNSEVTYRVRLGEKLVRDGSFKTRSTADQPVRFVMVGDLASGKPEQNGVAFEVSKARPDFLVALGDIVYSTGRVSQYLHHFWPTYNDVAKASATTGAPLMRTIPFYPVIGNHDVGAADVGSTPDGLGAFHFFHGPLNGPGEGAWTTPLGRNAAAAKTFRERVGASFPGLNVYSFDNGPGHFVMLDSNTYKERDFEAVRPWLEQDLRGSKARWKFVCFHAPAFHTSKEHYTEQKMRLFEPLFEATGVDIVFAGHVHNYQRSFPLRFKPAAEKPDARGRVDGEFTIDRAFDGVKQTHPNGVIHIVTGGGGAKLYSVDFEKTVEQLKKDNPGNWVPLTAKYVADRHSYTVVDLKPERLTLRQISIAGEEIDRVVIDKP